MASQKDWNFLSNACGKAIRNLEKMGAEQAEAFLLATKTVEVTIRNSEIFTENAIADAGVGFRAATAGNQVGFSCTNRVDSEKDVLEAGKRALSIARLSAAIPDFAMPTKSEAARVRGLFDKGVSEAHVEEAVNICRCLIKEAESTDRRVTAKDGRVSFSYILRRVTNSFGVDMEEKGTQAVAYVGATGSQGNEVTPTCYELELKRNADLNPEKIGKTAAEMVLAQFRAKPAENLEGTVIFGPEAVSDQLFSALANALNAEKVVAGQSPWAHNLAETVASEKVTIADDGTMEGGFSSRAFDDEGCTSQKTALISRGRLETLMHCATTASRLETENTGNASRFIGGYELAKQIIGSGYRTKPEIYPSNLVILPGTKTQEELMADVGKGILVESLAGFVQAGSGLISAQLARAHYIEHGELRWPLKGGMISGIAFDWLRRVRDVGNDAKRFINSVVPSLRVEDVKIIGAQ